MSCNCRFVAVENRLASSRSAGHMSLSDSSPHQRLNVVPHARIDLVVGSARTQFPECTRAATAFRVDPFRSLTIEMSVADQASEKTVFMLPRRLLTRNTRRRSCSNCG